MPTNAFAVDNHADDDTVRVCMIENLVQMPRLQSSTLSVANSSNSWSIRHHRPASPSSHHQKSNFMRGDAGHGWRMKGPDFEFRTTQL
jgi:hypothetical protein